jgi:pyruvate-formate lyase-activating enzyme
MGSSSRMSALTLAATFRWPGPLTSTALFKESESRRVQEEVLTEVPTEQPLGAILAYSGGAPFPATRQAASVLNAARMTQLANFYQSPFAGALLHA